MKILWFSNKQVLNKNVKDSGSWIVSMAEQLSASSYVELVNITEGNVNDIQKSTDDGVVEYVIPKFKVKKNGLPNKNNINSILDIVKKESPNLIHFWGVEKYWGLLYSRGYFKEFQCLLDIQGVLEACYESYKGTLHFSNFFRTMNLWNALYAYTFVTLQEIRMGKRVKNENEIIKSFKSIGVQSNWVQSWVKYKNPDAHIFRSEIAVRPEYLKSPLWQYKNQRNVLMVTSPQSYKRIDTAIQAIHVLKNNGIEATLTIVGNVLSNKGYPLYLKALINKLGVNDLVRFVGGMNVNEIIGIAMDSICALIPSSVESYSLVVAESLALGLPVIASYAGAMPEFMINNNVPLYFPSGDYVTCAERILSVINQQNELSISAMLEREKICCKNNPGDVQMIIYKQLLEG